MVLRIPQNTAYRRLFLAQIISLAGSGVSTIALALLARNLAGDGAGVLLGKALALKMVVYVFLTPILTALFQNLREKRVLVILDLFRSLVLLGFFLIYSEWHIYTLVFLLNLGSAAFTPIFQSMIPALLPDESDFNQALSLSRIAYDLENIASPLLAGILLSFINFSDLFLLDALSFVLSALLVLSIPFPRTHPAILPDDLLYRIRFGITSYLKTPWLRFGLALSWMASFAGAMIIVNTVIIVGIFYKSVETPITIAYGLAGLGSILVAIFTPALLRRWSERIVMLWGGSLLMAGFLAGAWIVDFYSLLAVWFLLGAGSSLIQTPAGMMLKKSCNPADRPAYFAAHFALTHLGWLFAYPMAGFFGRSLGYQNLFFIMAIAGVPILATILWLWNSRKQIRVVYHTHAPAFHNHYHVHDEHHRHHESEEENKLGHAHPHQHEALQHAHTFVIDYHHRRFVGN